MKLTRAQFIIISIYIVKVAAGYVVLPVMLNSIPTGVYGQYFLFMTMIGLASVALGFGFPNIINAYYNYAKRINIAKVLGANLIALQILISFLIFIVYTALDSLNIFSNAVLICILLFYSTSLALQSLIETILRFSGSLLTFLLISMLFTIIDSTAKLVYLKTVDFSIVSYIKISLLAYSIYFLFGIAYIVSHGKYAYYCCNRNVVFYKYARNNLYSNLIGRVFSILDRVVLYYLATPEMMDVYAIAQRFNNSLGGVRSFCKNFWLPVALQKINTKEIKQLNFTFLLLFFTCMCLVFLGAPIYLHLTTNIILSNDFFLILAFLLLTNLLWIQYYFMVACMISRKENKNLTKIQFISGFSMVAGLLTILFLGAYGVIFGIYTQLIATIFATGFYYKHVLKPNALLRLETVFFLVVYAILVSVVLSMRSII